MIRIRLELISVADLSDQAGWVLASAASQTGYLLFKRIDQKFGSSCTLSINKAIDNASWIMNLGSKALKLVELKAQSRELCLGQEPEMFAQLENNEETNTVVEKRNLQEVRLNDHTFCFTKNIVRMGVDWKWN